MRQEAEMYADEDNRRIKLIELKNQADALFHSYKSTIKDNGDLISQNLKTEAKEKLAALRAAFAAPDITVEAVKERLEKFQQTLFAIGASVYKQAEQEVKEFPGALDSDFTSKVDDLAESTVSEEEVDFKFEEENTVTADYEAIE